MTGGCGLQKMPPSNRGLHSEASSEHVVGHDLSTRSRWQCVAMVCDLTTILWGNIGNGWLLRVTEELL